VHPPLLVVRPVGGLLIGLEAGAVDDALGAPVGVLVDEVVQQLLDAVTARDRLEGLVRAVATRPGVRRRRCHSANGSMRRP